MDSALLQPTVWSAPLERLRASLPEGVVSGHFSGTFSRRSTGGREHHRTESGETFQPRLGGAYSAMDLLDDLSDLAPARPPGVTIEVGRSALPKVTLYELPDGETVSAGGPGAPISSVQRGGAVPAPYRRLPVIVPSAWDAGMDPEWLGGVVRAALPQASGMTPDEVRAWESQSHCVLPPDVRALYLAAADGDLVLPTDPDDADGEPRSVMRIRPLGQQDPHWGPQARFASWRFGATEVIGPDPTGRVQPLGFSPAWVPIGDNWGGDYFVADLAPGPNGTIGQILFVDHETSAGATWVAPSLTAFVADPPDRYGRLPEPGALKVRIGRNTTQTLASVVPDTEVLIVTQVNEPVNLKPVAGHSRLRTVEVGPGSVTGVEVIEQLPALEYFAADLATWRQLIDRQLVPAQLLAAGFIDPTATWPDTVAVANELLRRWGQPLITAHVC